MNLTSRITSDNGDNFLRIASKWSWIILIICVVYQIIFYPGFSNFFALGCIIFAWLMVTAFFFRLEFVRKNPFSMMLITGFTATQFYFPLLFTTIENNPVVFNLDIPEQVFLHSTAALLVVILAHTVYRLLCPLNKTRSNSILDKLSFFQAPSDFQLWLMGFIGLAATYYVFFNSPGVVREVSGAATDKKIFQNLIPFSYAPFFIPFGKLYGSKLTSSRKVIVMLIGYTILLFAMSIGRNSRGAFMLGFTSVGLAYALGLMNGIWKARLFTLKNAIIGSLVFWLLTGPIADLGTAMVIVRDERSNVEASDLIGRTLETFQDKRAIQLRRWDDNLQESDWDERYLNNIFAARFANLKFNDVSLVQAEKIGSKNQDMFDFSTDYIWGILPDPIIKALNPKVDKEAVYSISFGDYIYYLAGGEWEISGGFKTGHFSGTGMAAFGWGYLLILGFAMIPIFFLLDRFVLIKKLSQTLETNTQIIDVRYSFCGLLALTSVFQFLPSESVVTIFSFLLRGWLQTIIIYFLVFHFSLWLGNFFQSRARKYQSG